MQVSALFFTLDLIIWGQASAGAVPVPMAAAERHASTEHAKVHLVVGTILFDTIA